MTQRDQQRTTPNRLHLDAYEAMLRASVYAVLVQYGHDIPFIKVTDQIRDAFAECREHFEDMLPRWIDGDTILYGKDQGEVKEEGTQAEHEGEPHSLR